MKDILTSHSTHFSYSHTRLLLAGHTKIKNTCDTYQYIFALVYF